MTMKDESVSTTGNTTKPGNFPATFPWCATALFLGIASAAGCSGGGSGSTGGGGTPPAQPAATPTIATTAAQNSAVIVTLSDATSGATIYYTIDGTTPTTSSRQYIAPFLVASNLTLNAIATASGYTSSAVATQAFSANIASGTLVWSDEFTNTGAGSSAYVQPSPSTWTYDTGTDCCGNSELETYCAWGSTTSPAIPPVPTRTSAPRTATCTSSRRTPRYRLHLGAPQIPGAVQLPVRPHRSPHDAAGIAGHVARLLAAGQQHHHQSMAWPAANSTSWNTSTAAIPPSTAAAPRLRLGAVLWRTARNLNGGAPYTATGFSAAAWHTYGMIWTKGQVQFYIDSPTNIYETFNHRHHASPARGPSIRDRCSSS